MTDAADPVILSLAPMAWHEEMLHLTSGPEPSDAVYWLIHEGELRVYMQCSDIFTWGTADSQPITSQSLSELAYARRDLLDAGDEEMIYLGALYCARCRGMRPQGAFYRDIPESVAALFDLCGPVRETNMLNPVGRV